MNDCNGKTILLVEDEAIIAADEKKILENYGYAVIAARNGEEALRIMESAPVVDLVLMDINLGSGMSGTEAAGRILADHDIPLIFISSHTEPDVVRKTEGITSYGYIVKNSGETVLLSSIKMAFRLFDARQNERKKAEALQHTHDLMRYIIEHNWSDIAVHDRDLRYIYVSQSYLEHYQVKDKDIIGRHCLEVFPDMPENRKDALGKSLAGEIVKGEDDPWRRPDGAVEWTRWECRPWYEADGSIGGIITYSEIISERKHAEEQLKFSEEKFLKAFMKNPVSMGITRVKDLKIIDINETFLKKSGYRREEVIGHTSPELLLWENLEEREKAREILFRDGEIVGKEYRYRMKDGTILDGEYSGFFITIGGEKHILIWILDITDRKRAEERVRSLLREKELLLREVHHRIKNNMNTIKSLLSLQSRTVKSRDAAEALQDAMGRVQSMGMLYDKLNSSSAVNDMPVDLYLLPLVDQIISLFPGSSAVKIEKDIGDFTLGVNVLTPLGIIVNELVTNAMKYAFSEGRGGTIWVSSLRQERTVTVAVENDGIPLPDDFSMGKHGGFGLELVDMLAKQIRGSVRAERGKGARFVVEFDAGESSD